MLLEQVELTRRPGWLKTKVSVRLSPVTTKGYSHTALAVTLVRHNLLRHNEYDFVQSKDGVWIEWMTTNVCIPAIEKRVESAQKKLSEMMDKATEFNTFNSIWKDIHEKDNK